MIDCHDVMRRLWEYLDGELPRDQVALLREHLTVCARCSPHHRFQLAFLALVADAAKARPPRPEFVTRLRASLASVED